MRKANWTDNRNIQLNGEAYFKVETGNTFTVSTKAGEVSVLGTQFNVQSYTGLFAVTCYEGKVSVTTEAGAHILLPGNRFILVNNTESLSTTTEEEPGWTNNESTFESIPIQFVLLALENQFNLKFDYDKLPEVELYTGGFPHSDAESALDIVLGALGLEYELKDQTVIIKE